METVNVFLPRASSSSMVRSWRVEPRPLYSTLSPLTTASTSS
ncbi:unnamed protein product [Arabidopsis lyrata]|nr:unnamed protein product [Arabidopsis lyrata]